MKHLFLQICIFLCLAGCSEKKPFGKFPVIDVVNSIDNYQRIYCSDYFSSLELIPLEMNKECLVGEDPTICFHNNLFFITSITSLPVIPRDRNFLVFNRSGKFLNQIGRIGRGPGEYSFYLDAFLNTDKPTAFVQEYEKIFEYGLTGTLYVPSKSQL